MDKVWYINIYGNHEGPFSILDLKRDDRITPDTLVWKEGFSKWKPIREVPELNEVFTDESSHEVKDDEKIIKKPSTLPQDEIVLDMRNEPPYFWLFVLVVILIYLISQLFWSSP